MKSEIVSHIIIKENRVWVNNTEINIEVFDGDFLKSIYKYLEIQYPKFYKMDELSKLGFIASELLLSDAQSVAAIEKFDNNKTGIVLQNSDSTVDVDTEFYELISDKDNHHPSPALFVYTLPNISIGEISIYNKFHGENALFVSENYNVELGVSYINTLLDKNKIDACLGGWFNACKGSYDAFLYFVTKTDLLHVENDHNKENIIKLNKNLV